MALSRETYPFVDVLRGFAAILVLVFHAMHVGGRQEFPDAEIWHFFDYGWVGVNLFLVISGFVITLSGFRHLELYPHSFARAFAISRLARITPLYLLTGLAFLLVANPAWLHGPLPDKLLHIGTHLGFVHNLFPSTHGSIDGPNWSIALEVQFYVLFLLIAPWLVRRAGLTHVVLALLLATLFRLVASHTIAPGQPTLQFIYATQLPGVIGHFALGAAVAFAVQPSKRFVLSAPVASWRNFAAWTSLSLFALGVSTALLQRFGYWENTWMVTFLPSVLSFGFMASLVAGITFPLARDAAFVPFRYLGEISYGLYLWHMPVMLLLDRVYPGLEGVPFLAVVCALTFVLSVVSWHLIEKPLSRYFRERMAPERLEGVTLTPAIAR